MSDLNLIQRFRMGNVVKWVDSLYIVTEVRDESLRLIPINGENVAASPSTKWPFRTIYECTGTTEPCEDGPDMYCVNNLIGGCITRREPDPGKTVDTITVVARTVEELVMSRVKNLLLRP